MFAQRDPVNVPIRTVPASGRPRESSRSSRRKVSSTGPQVVLGGGAGLVGGPGRVNDGASQELRPIFYGRPKQTPSPTFPVHFPSPTFPALDSSTPANLPSVNQRRDSPPFVSSSKRSVSPMPTASADSRSANSLSTTASTSSHTLKTPHSKVDYSRSPVIASGSGSSDDHASPVAAMAVRRAKEIAEPMSPTPTQPRLSSEGQNPSERVLRERLPPPPLTHTPLPLTPVGFAATSMHEENTARRLSDAPRRSRQHPPAPLDMRNENRLSKDWIPVHVSGPSSPDQMRPKSNSPHPEPVLSQHHRAKWPAATMVPVKESPKRPSFERAQIAPPIAITERKQTEGRVSLDHMRNTSPTRTTSRQNSRSTPPAAMLDMAIASTGNRLHVFHDGTTRNVSPLRTRSSEDVLRPSMDSTRAGMTKKHIKAKQKEQQQGLGVASTVVNSSSGAEPDRKSSGLSLKKSSGALRNLFSRGVSGKGKDRMETPPMPLAEDRAKVRGRPSTAPTSDDSRPHPSFGQPRTPGSVLPTRVASVGQESPSVGPGRSSLSIERTVYPAPPLSRAASQGSQPVMSLPVRARSPQRDLPPLPAPSPVPPFEHRSTQSTLAEALPASSLPYLSPMRASFLLETNDPNRLSTSADRFSSVSSSASTARPTENASEEISPIKPSRSLHLLQLPDFDLDLADAFDKIGMSPATPRKLSPRRSPQAKASPKSPTPQRSLTTRLSPTASPPTISRTGSERRRSQSFDGPPSHADLWRVDAVKLFASATSTSAPMLSNSNAPAATEEVPPPVPLLMTVPQHIHNHSVSSQPSAPSSSDHARTPSNTSSTNETSSPSPPHTPREEKSPVVLSIGDFESPSRLPTPTASAPDGPEHSLAARKPFVFSKPPSIPLPAAPVPVWSPALAPFAVIELVEPVEPEQNVIKGPRKNKRVLLSRSKLVTAETTVSSKTLGRELELLLYSFRYPSGSSTAADRANLIRNDLLPLLLEIEKRPFNPSEQPGNATPREACFNWADALLQELRAEQAANERGACLEGLAGVLESSCLSERALLHAAVHREKFIKLMMRGMSFVMGKLGAKGVFHNTLLFSGRFLAFAFFRVPHVGEQLVTVLQPPRGALMRFTRDALQGPPIPSTARPQYPKHLLPLCFDDSRSYTTRLTTLAPDFSTEQERDAFLFQPGNWLRRWQSDDSELFPAFYRAYHRQLAQYLAPAVEYYEAQTQAIPTKVLLQAPGYAHLATIFAKKCHSYILGSVNAVTTSSSAQSFEATETAGFRGSQKPAVLETANRRLVETLSMFANLHVMVPDTKGRVMECDGGQLWADMLDHWTKNLIGKTSLYAPKGIFSLFDLLDGIADPPLDPISGQRCLTAQSLLDVPHLIYVIRLILTEGEHALTLVKVIAFVFTHWEVLTAQPEDRKELCLELLLERKIFERLLLFWSQSVRSYVLRLVVFRLGHLHTKAEDGAGHEVEMESVRLLQTRLDRIKKRHDELEPRTTMETGEIDAAGLTPAEGGIARSRSTITMVTDSPQTGSVAKAERLLGLGLGQDVEDGGKRIGKAASWLKKSLGTKKKRNSGSLPVTPEIGGSRSPSIDGASPVLSHTSPVIPYDSPALQQSPKPLSSPALLWPASRSSNEWSNGSLPPTDARKTRPPDIVTSSPGIPAPASAGSFKFEFELPTVSPRSDTFDPTPTPSSPRRNSQPPSPRQPTSPHMSRSFSKRSSLLPPPTASALEAAVSPKVQSPLKPVHEEGYDQKLHAYAIRMLAELEDAQKEYDEWWSDGGVGRMDGAPPRLTVAWPFHEGED